MPPEQRWGGYKKNIKALPAWNFHCLKCQALDVKTGSGRPRKPSRQRCTSAGRKCKIPYDCKGAAGRFSWQRGGCDGSQKETLPAPSSLKSTSEVCRARSRVSLETSAISLKYVGTNVLQSVSDLRLKRGWLLQQGRWFKAEHASPWL